ncbi:MAG: helix-turn-helix domain-containing protein [Dongiaceae bacterium]
MSALHKQASQIEEKLVKLLRDERKKQGLSYEQLADKCGLHRTTISLIERNKYQPTLVSLLKIALGLKVSLAELMKRVETKN